ncbi:DUF1003 domain-containing protein [Propionicicella superfundia]|uniref:DUF1003 domain-containing protein n=1 Tax=Propionicicella superfundia TaxID=348582 RepID=UPI0004913A03|nr:DUF1003 domain-containing protein [Propionicicella superfundia]
MASAQAKLNTPGGRRRWGPRRRMDSDSFGRFAEGVARYMGTANFVMWMTVFVVVWVLANVLLVTGLRWDPYPFILLNLFFSTQASYAAPLILLAQNRQEARDRISLENDREMAAQSRADMDFLAREIASLRQKVNDLASRDFVRSELRELVEELREDQRQPDVGSTGERPASSQGASL